MRELSECSIHIIGLGLMGGSLAMALKPHVKRLTAHDLDPTVLEDAIGKQLLHNSGGLAEADIVVLAIPAHRITNLIEQLGQDASLQPDTLIMDIGSTKTAICNALDHLPDHLLAVGGHPMCGLAENSYWNAVPTLYQDARFVLCETNRTTPDVRQLAEALVTATGAVHLWMDRERHDYLTALTSHLPHLLSFGLMQLAMLESAKDPDLYQLAAGGFDGATRLARTQENMISGMFSTNADHLRQLAGQLRAQLDQIEALFEDPDALEAMLAEIVKARRTYSSTYGERPIA